MRVSPPYPIQHRHRGAAKTARQVDSPLPKRRSTIESASRVGRCRPQLDARARPLGTLAVLRVVSPITHSTILALALAGCATERAPVAQRLPPVQAPSIREPPKQAVQEQPREITKTRWAITANGCSEGASLSGNDFSLVISDRGAAAAGLVVKFGHGRQWRKPPLHSDVRLEFDGSRGSWSAEGRLTRLSANFGMAADDLFLARVMAMLNGGTVTLFARRAKLLTAIVPPAGARGQTWFECMRAHIL